MWVIAEFDKFGKCCGLMSDYVYENIKDARYELEQYKKMFPNLDMRIFVLRDF